MSPTQISAMLAQLQRGEVVLVVLDREAVSLLKQSIEILEIERQTPKPHSVRFHDAVLTRIRAARVLEEAALSALEEQG